LYKIYNTDLQTNRIKEINEFEKGSWINIVSPTDKEISLICEKLGIEEEYLKYPLDLEEKARIDSDDEGNLLFIVDVPIIEKENDSETDVYSTMPLGMMVVQDKYFITISSKQNEIIKFMEKSVQKGLETYKKSKFIFEILYANASVFLKYLKLISKETEIAESVLKNSMKNKELLQLLSLEKSLVYFTTSLKANEIVMEKTLRGKIIKLYEEDEELLEDAIIENKQAIEMSRIYSDILNGTMDAYASIISNNLNGVMKFLTSITIILAIPTLIASMWGMNVPVPLQGSEYGFHILLVISSIVTLITMMWLKKKGFMN